MIIIESQCLPPISVFCEVIRWKGITIEQYENYQKRSFRNRFYIAGPNGIQFLTVPLQKGKNEQCPIGEVRLSYDTNWPAHFKKVLEGAYGRAPFFDYYIDSLQAIFHQRSEHLLQLNSNLLNWALTRLDLEIIPAITTKYEKATTSVRDYRGFFRPNIMVDWSKYFIQYEQVFSERNSFIPNLSIIDLLFCMGPEASEVLSRSVQS